MPLKSAFYILNVYFILLARKTQLCLEAFTIKVNLINLDLLNQAKNNPMVLTS